MRLNEFSHRLSDDLKNPVKISIAVTAELYRDNIAIASKSGRKSDAGRDLDLRPWLAAEPNLEVEAPEIREAAAQIDARDDLTKVRKIMTFVQRTVKCCGLPHEKWTGG